MRCPKCGFRDTRVTDSRTTDGGDAIRRRRRCPKCRTRFTTYERIALSPTTLVVVKKDGRRELFDRNKIELGMLKACEKRPVTLQQVREAIDDIETNLRRSGRREVSTREIGQQVMEKLLALDDVAYIRFASVYQEFDDARRFAEALAALGKSKRRKRQRSGRLKSKKAAARAT